MTFRLMVHVSVAGLTAYCMALIDRDNTDIIKLTFRHNPAGCSTQISDIEKNLLGKLSCLIEYWNGYTEEMTIILRPGIVFVYGFDHPYMVL